MKDKGTPMPMEVQSYTVNWAAFRALSMDVQLATLFYKDYPGDGGVLRTWLASEHGAAWGDASTIHTTFDTKTQCVTYVGYP